MNIGGPIPFHAARAYGVPRPAPVRAAVPVTPTAPAPAADSTAPEPGARIKSLLAGRVPGVVDFDSAQNGMDRTPERLTLYTRAADKVEAATGVQLGRALDVRG